MRIGYCIKQTKLWGLFEPPLVRKPRVNKVVPGNQKQIVRLTD
ncbi:MAG: hypothetical protein ACUVQK_01845 [Thermogutta sp.]